MFLIKKEVILLIINLLDSFFAKICKKFVLTVDILLFCAYNIIGGNTMTNTVIKSISATNFGPFKETVTFDMETSVPKGQIVDNHTFFAGENQQFNKVAYIYGANGSGKSNFCKILCA